MTSRRREVLPSPPQCTALRGAAAGVLQAVHRCGRHPERGHDPEDHPRRDRHGQRKEQHLRVDRDLVQTRHALRSQHADAIQRRNGQQHADAAAGQREDDALRQKLADQASSRRADCSADGHLAAAREPSREQQVRHVRAGNQQHEANRRRQHEHRSPRVADDLLLQRHDAEGQAAVGGIDVRMLAAESRRQRVHLGLSGRDRHAWLQLAKQVVVFAVSHERGVGGERQRQDDVRVLGAPERRHHFARQVEPGGKHADHFVGLSIEREDAAEYMPVAAVPSHPRAVREQRRAGAARLIIVRREQPPEPGAHAEHRQEVRRDSDRADPFRFTVTGQIPVRANRNRDGLEPAVRADDVEILRRRKPVFGDADARRSVPEDDQSIGVTVRQRAQQERAGDAEDRGVGADADRDRQNRRHREPGRTHQGAERAAKIGDGVPHRRRFCLRRGRADVRFSP